MRDHIRREAMSHDIPASWFIVPMSIAIVVLVALATLEGTADASASPQLVPAATVTVPDIVSPTQGMQPSDDVPATSEHVQAF